jgi:hypothetical protein
MGNWPVAALRKIFPDAWTSPKGPPLDLPHAGKIFIVGFLRSNAVFLG